MDYITTVANAIIIIAIIICYCDGIMKHFLRFIPEHVLKISMTLNILSGMGTEEERLD